MSSAMLSSMTGFSRSERTEGGIRTIVEVRSLNNKFLELFVKLPRRFSEFEDGLKNIIREKTTRGKIDVTVTLEGVDEVIEHVSVNRALARGYFDAIKQLEAEFGVPVMIKPEDLIKIEDLFEYSVSNKQLLKVKKLIEKTLKSALCELEKHKREEGINLKNDLLGHINLIDKSMRKVCSIAQSRRQDDYEQLKLRIFKLVPEHEKIDSNRLEMEVAFLAEKFDISEECVRLESHLALFKNAMSSHEPVGRRLDFILQELNREANTISSKSNNVIISQEVVKIKEEIEKLKEQVRNVE